MDKSTINKLNEYVLIKIFNNLNINDKISCSQVNRNWNFILKTQACQPKVLTVILNSDTPIKEINCDHFKKEKFYKKLKKKESSIFNLKHYLNESLFNKTSLFSNLRLLIINFIFVDNFNKSILNISKLKKLKYLEIHGDNFEIRSETINLSLEHLFVEQFDPELFIKFPNIKCLCINQLDFEIENLQSNFELSKLKINFVPVHFGYHIDFIQILFLITPNLEHLYIILALSDKLNPTCGLNKLLSLISCLTNLKVIELEFNLDELLDFSPINSFVINLIYELSQNNNVQLITHFNYSKSLDLESLTETIDLKSFLKTNSLKQNELVINGKSFDYSEINDLLKYYHVINVEVLYINNINLFDNSKIYDYLKNVHTICFECNPGNYLNEILNNLSQVKHIYFDCTINQQLIDLLPFKMPGLKMVALENFDGQLDLNFVKNFECLRSLFLGDIENLNVSQICSMLEQCKNLTYFSIECKLLGDSINKILKTFSNNAKKSLELYHINLSSINCSNTFIDNLNKLIKIYKGPNLKITIC